jgi:hypothetical protein
MVNRAEMLERRTRTAMFARVFERGVVEFSELLSTTADTRPDDVSAPDLDRLAALAGNVIQSIENRLESHRDAQATQLRLATTIYRIRAELEELSRWRRQLGV